MSVAYDGYSKRRQTRKLQPLERDILTRVLSDILHVLRRTNDINALCFVDGNGFIRLDPDEVKILVDLRAILDPRSGT